MRRKVLIANRGEIAVRIIRACREMGIRTVAVCSEADRDALHSQLADECICIGAAPAKESYLKMERILSAAIASGADAIHPGFGFLSENARFAGLCARCGLIFIGPSGEVIERLGNKAAARTCMMMAGVPVVPGSDGPTASVQDALKLAESFGYPVIIKASAGGGGRGMRVVRLREEFEESFLTAQAEARNAFGDGTMYLEKYVEHARHIEFQILGDMEGNVIHLGERDCSVQRRHQKLIEEAPAPGMSDELRARMGADAVKAAKAAGYTGAGTVEFLLDSDQRYYFIEMNTRIQVEHGVTELVTGIDLVKEQIRIASGEVLTLCQEDVSIRGHAMECRINAEDPARDFIPCPGTVEELHIPGGNGIRVDTALYPGYQIPPYYDSLLAKVMAVSPNREETILKLRSALGELVIDGVTTNLDFQYQLLGDERFFAGGVDTGYVEAFLSMNMAAPDYAKESEK